MAKMNVAQFAGELGLPVGLLLEQLQAAGVAKQQDADTISEQDKAQLLEHLRNAHGGSNAKPKITLVRRETSEIKKSDSAGRPRTIQVEVRKKRIVAPTPPTAPAMLPEAVKPEVALQEVAPPVVAKPEIVIPAQQPAAVPEPTPVAAAPEVKQEKAPAAPVSPATPARK